MGFVPDLKLVIKNTFLEFVCEDVAWLLEGKQSRKRSSTEPILQLSRLLDDLATSINETLSPSISQSSYKVFNARPPSSDDYRNAQIISDVPPLRSQQGSEADFALTRPTSRGTYERDAYFQGMQHRHSSACSECSVATIWEKPDSEFQVGETRTTVMLRGLPKSVTRSAFLRMLNAAGFLGSYDFIYVPIDFKRNETLGYALVNMVSSSEAWRLRLHFDGFSSWNVPCDVPCTVNWCSSQQGLAAHIERYRNNPIMHESVPDEWKPILLSNSVPVVFPPPTIMLKVPRLKRSRRMLQD